LAALSLRFYPTKSYFGLFFRYRGCKPEPQKIYNRGDRTVQAIADDLNINSWTLKNWMKLPKDVVEGQAGLITKRPQDWNQSERFQLILDSQGKKGNLACLVSGTRDFPASFTRLA
jgi:hypothetical protein